MPLIRISHATRLGAESKETLLRRVTEAYAEATGSDPAKVWVILEELDRNDWASGGTSLASRDAAANKS